MLNSAALLDSTRFNTVRLVTNTNLSTNITAVSTTATITTSTVFDYVTQHIHGSGATFQKNPEITSLGEMYKTAKGEQIQHGVK